MVYPPLLRKAATTWVTSSLMRQVELYDPVLEEPLTYCELSISTSYLSKYTQSDVIACILEHIQSAIITEVKSQAGLFIFPISADKVTALSNMEPLVVAVLAVGVGDVIHKRLLGYVEMESITGNQ